MQPKQKQIWGKIRHTFPIFITAKCLAGEVPHDEALMHFVRFRDGKGIGHRAARDDLGLMQQLGVIPAHDG